MPVRDHIVRNSANAIVVFIYGLFDDKGIRYIGQSMKPRERFFAHLAEKEKSHKGNWIRSLKTRGLRPKMVILEESDEFNFEDRERFWISFGRQIGWDLTNGTEGGDKAPRYTDAVLQKMRLSHLGRKQSPEAIAKMSAAMRGKPKSEDHRKNIGLASLGRKSSEAKKRKHSEDMKARMSNPEFRQKMATINLGRPCPDHVKQAVSARAAERYANPEYAKRHADAVRSAVKGRKASEETRKKIREAAKARYSDPAFRAKMSEIRIGTKPSDEARAKMSAAGIERHRRERAIKQAGQLELFPGLAGASFPVVVP